jgi:hypothetical protein
MTDRQLHQFLRWLDHRGGLAGKTFAVHQVDPRDPGSRALLELQVADVGPPRPRKKLRLTSPAGHPRWLGRASMD